MKVFFTVVLIVFFVVALCLSEDKVYTNADLESGKVDKGQMSPDAVSKGGGVIHRSFVTPQQTGSDGPIRVPNPYRKPASPGRGDATDRMVTRPLTPAVNPLSQLIAGICGGITLFMLAAVGIPFAIWLICLIDVLRSEFTSNNKIIWFLLVFFVPVIGSILYYFIGTDQKVVPEEEEPPGRPVWPKGGW